MSARRAALAAGLAVLVCVAFSGALRNEFVAYDDDLYVTANPLVLGGLTVDGIGRAFREFHAGNWHPLTWFSHMADVELFGLAPAPHHAVSVAIHALNALLVFALLATLTGATWRAVVVAALFAVHPLRVESVAWVAERKDLLSTAFGLLALLAWVRFARDGRPSARAAALASFALSLLAKPMLVTLPFLMLVLDAWPLARLRSAADVWPRVREKLGFFALAAGSCLVTLAAQAPAMTPVPLALRLANALLAYPAYLARIFWPDALAALYPYRTSVPVADVLGAGALVLALTALGLWQARRRPWLLVGWLWFAGLLVPTLGLVQVGVQAFADRYTYLPLVGVALAVVWSAAELVERVPRAKPVALALAGVVIGICVARTRAQVEVWRDSVTLFAHAAAVTRDNWFAHAELGIALAARGELARARAELETSLRLHPRYARARANLGVVRAQAGDPENGIADLRSALALDPALRGGQLALGLVLERSGRFAEASSAYRAALALDPNDRAAALQLARLLAIAPDERLRDGDAAVALCEQACGAGGCRTAEEFDVLGMALIEAGRRDEALAAAQRAVELARARGDAPLASRIESRRESYARGEPVRVRAATPSPGG